MPRRQRLELPLTRSLAVAAAEAFDAAPLILVARDFRELALFNQPYALKNCPEFVTSLSAKF